MPASGAHASAHSKGQCYACNIEKDKLPLKNHAHCDSFDTVTFNYIIVLHGADTLVFVLYNTVHLNNNNNNNNNIVYVIIGMFGCINNIIKIERYNRHTCACYTLLVCSPYWACMCTVVIHVCTEDEAVQ